MRQRVACCSHRAREQLPLRSHGDVSRYVQSLARLVRHDVAPCHHTTVEGRNETSAFATRIEGGEEQRKQGVRGRSVVRGTVQSCVMDTAASRLPVEYTIR